MKARYELSSFHQKDGKKLGVLYSPPHESAREREGERQDNTRKKLSHDNYSTENKERANWLLVCASNLPFLKSTINAYKTISTIYALLVLFHVKSD